MTEGNPSTESVDECNCTSDDDLTTEKLVKPKQMSSADWIKEVCCVLTRQIDMDLDLIKGMKTDIIMSWNCIKTSGRIAGHDKQ